MPIDLMLLIVDPERVGIKGICDWKLLFGVEVRSGGVRELVVPST